MKLIANPGQEYGYQSNCCIDIPVRYHNELYLTFFLLDATLDIKLQLSGKKFYVNKPHRLTDFIGPNTAVIIFRGDAPS